MLRETAMDTKQEKLAMVRLNYVGVLLRTFADILVSPTHFTAPVPEASPSCMSSNEKTRADHQQTAVGGAAGQPLIQH